MTDTDPAAEDEAIQAERLDADLQQAEMDTYGDVIAYRWRHGVCCHMSAGGYLPDPVYPQQRGLLPGQVRCTDPSTVPGGCGYVFDSDAHWDQAREDSVEGDAAPWPGRPAGPGDDQAICGPCGEVLQRIQPAGVIWRSVAGDSTCRRATPGNLECWHDPRVFPRSVPPMGPWPNPNP